MPGILVHAQCGRIVLGGLQIKGPTPKCVADPLFLFFKHPQVEILFYYLIICVIVILLAVVLSSTVQTMWYCYVNSDNNVPP